MSILAGRSKSKSSGAPVNCVVTAFPFGIRVSTVAEEKNLSSDPWLKDQLLIYVRNKVYKLIIRMGASAMIVYENDLCNTFFRMSQRFNARIRFRVIHHNLSLLKASLRGYVITALCHLR